MKLSLFLPVLLAIGFSISCRKINSKESNSPIVYFPGTLNDKVQKVSPTRDGGFLYCGITLTKGSDSKAFLMKTSSKGELEWFQNYGDSTFTKFHHAIQCSDGGYVAVGLRGMLGVTGPWITSNVEFLVKTDAKGKMEWSKCFTANEYAVCELFDVVESEDHFIYATGYYPSPTHWQDVFLVKCDLQGNSIYYKGIQVKNNTPPKLIQDSKISFASGLNITINKTGEILIGAAIATLSFPGAPGVSIPALINVSPNGNLNSYYPYFGLNVQSLYNRTSDSKKGDVQVICSSDGYYLSWYHDSTIGGKVYEGIKLLKTDLQGNPKWNKSYFGEGSAIVNNMIRNEDGTLLICGGSTKEQLDVNFPEGFVNINPYLLKVDSVGNIIFQNVIVTGLNASLLKSCQTLSNGDLGAAGYTALNSQGYDKMFRIRLNNLTGMIQR